MLAVTEFEVETKLQSVFELLAAAEHERWAKWQLNLHSLGAVQPNGNLLLPADHVQRWQRQCRSDYFELSEVEKDSDRLQVRQYLPIILAALRTSA